MYDFLMVLKIEFLFTIQNKKDTSNIVVGKEKSR